MSTAFIIATPFSASAPALRPVATSRRAVPVMSARKKAARLATIPATLVTVAPALATEGTGEALGVDTPLLFLPLVLIPIVFFVLYLQFGRSQDNDDFVGEYDERRN